jgi:hypothetical protein
MWIAVPLLAATLLAQQPLPMGITRASLVGWQGSSSSGSLLVRRADGELYGCLFDRHTLFQRNELAVRVDTFRPEEPVEVVSDRPPDSSGCYARMLSIVANAPGVSPRHRTPEAAARTEPAAKVLVRRGYLTLAGRVLRIRAPEMTIRTHDGDRAVRLREDTRYSHDGVRLDSPDAPAALMNRHVFLRGGRTLSGDWEAYQVMWGEIFEAP